MSSASGSEGSYDFSRTGVLATRISQALICRVRLKSNLHHWFHPLLQFGFIAMTLKNQNEIKKWIFIFCWRRFSGMDVFLLNPAVVVFGKLVVKLYLISSSGTATGTALSPPPALALSSALCAAIKRPAGSPASRGNSAMPMLTVILANLPSLRRKVCP